jgi:hypothetical protein
VGVSLAVLDLGNGYRARIHAPRAKCGDSNWYHYHHVIMTVAIETDEHQV